METTQTFEAFAIIELFGHNKLAGKCTEQNIAGTNFLRVDVPKTTLQPPYTRLLNHAAIYAINPVTEEIANAYAERLQAAPITAYDIREQMKMASEQKSLPEKKYPEDANEGLDEEEEEDEERIDYSDRN